MWLAEELKLKTKTLKWTYGPLPLKLRKRRTWE